MTSEPAYLWFWLPGATEPVVCGRLDQRGPELWFTYARTYRERSDAMALQPDGLPLVSGSHRPPAPLIAHGAVRDAAPDSWGMRVILRRIVGTTSEDTADLPLLRYLRESGSNRIGAMDVQDRPDVYVPRQTHGTLEELLTAAERVEQGVSFSQELDDALTYGTAVGGARPKALLTAADGTELIAKFGLSTDTFPWMQAEAVGMELARRCGVDTAPSRLVKVAARDVLLVTRFDRPGPGQRLHVLSALTLFGLDELAARHGSYVDLVDQVKVGFTDPQHTLAELFTRLAVNILVGNTDDHPRNHAASYDGTLLTLTPAYDICPQPRSGGETAQAMPYGINGQRSSRLTSLVGAADVFQLRRLQAQAIVDRCATVVTEQFDDVCMLVGASDATRDLLWGRAVANPSVFYD